VSNLLTPLDKDKTDTTKFAFRKSMTSKTIVALGEKDKTVFRIDKKLSDDPYDENFEV
jgi:hypothetical protein